MVVGRRCEGIKKALVEFVGRARIYHLGFDGLSVDVLDLFEPHSSDLARVPPGLHYYVADMRTAVDRSNSLTDAPFPVAFHGKIATMAENENLQMSKRRQGARNVPCPRHHPGLVRPPSCIMK